MPMIMTAPTRLDRIANLREEEENRAAQALAAATRAVETCRAAIRIAERQANSGAAIESSADLLLLSEAARASARRRIRLANDGLQAALVNEKVARQAHLLAHQRTETIRRAAATRLTQLREDEGRVERTQMDELALMAFARRG